MPNTPSSPEPTSGCKDCDIHPNRLCDAYPDCGRGRAEDDFVLRIKTPRGIITPHGIMEIIPATPFRPDLLEPLSDEERRAAAQHYIETKYGQRIGRDVAERQAAVYNLMIRRETGGSDPLVQEPKD